MCLEEFRDGRNAGHMIAYLLLHNKYGLLTVKYIVTVDPLRSQDGH